MTKEEVIKHLKNVRVTKLLLRSCDEKLRELRSNAEKITPSYSQAPSSGGDGRKLENAMVRIMGAEDRLEKERKQYSEALEKALDLISSLESRSARYILFERYLNNKSWTQITISMQYSRSQVFRIHQKAIEQLADK